MTTRGATLRRGASVLLACAALLAGIGSAESPAAASTGSSSAVAVNTKDGSSVFRLRLSLLRAGGDVVDPVNAAVAFSSCDSCQTVAIAIQAVLVFSEPSVAAPVNLALAINEDCTSCQTLASAYQFVLGTGGPAHLTSEGNRRIAEIRRQLKDLRDAGLGIEEIQSRTDQLASQLQEVLSTELVSAGRPDTGTPDQPSGSGSATPDDTSAPPDTAREETRTTPAAPPDGEPSGAEPTTAPEQGDSSAATEPPAETTTAPSEQDTSTTEGSTGTTTQGP
jgi:putative peptide zinc metalloprotease protein